MQRKAAITNYREFVYISSELLDAIIDVIGQCLLEKDPIINSWDYIFNGRGLVYRIHNGVRENLSLIFCARHLIKRASDLGAFPHVEQEAHYVIERCTHMIETLALVCDIAIGDCDE